MHGALAFLLDTDGIPFRYFPLLYFSYFTNLEDIDWTSLESLKADGKIKTDGFDAIKLATTFPFNPTATRMIALLMTKEQVYKYEPRSEKTGLWGFRPCMTQTRLYSLRRRLEA